MSCLLFFSVLSFFPHPNHTINTAARSGEYVDVRSVEQMLPQLLFDGPDVHIFSGTSASAGRFEARVVEPLRLRNVVQHVAVTRGISCRKWKSAILLVVVTPILKTGKNASLPQAYRPVALLSCLSKVLERFVHEQLSSFQLESKALPDDQFGFLRNRLFRTTFEPRVFRGYCCGSTAKSESKKAVTSRPDTTVNEGSADAEKKEKNNDATSDGFTQPKRRKPRKPTPSNSLAGKRVSGNPTLCAAPSESQHRLSTLLEFRWRAPQTTLQIVSYCRTRSRSYWLLLGEIRVACGEHNLPNYLLRLRPRTTDQILDESFWPEHTRCRKWDEHPIHRRPSSMQL